MTKDVDTFDRIPEKVMDDGIDCSLVSLDTDLTFPQGSVSCKQFESLGDVADDIDKVTVLPVLLVISHSLLDDYHDDFIRK